MTLCIVPHTDILKQRYRFVLTQIHDMCQPCAVSLKFRIVHYKMTFYLQKYLRTRNKTTNNLDIHNTACTMLAMKSTH